MNTDAVLDKVQKTILLVEDDAGNRRILAEILSDLGYKVIAEPDGTSALSTIRHGVDIDLVVTDYRMPDMTGLDLVVTLRQVMPAVPVIMLTAYGSIENYFRSMSLGVFEYINKPIEKHEFEQIVKTALHGPKTTQTPFGLNGQVS